MLCVVSQAQSFAEYAEKGVACETMWCSDDLQFVMWNECSDVIFLCVLTVTCPTALCTITPAPFVNSSNIKMFS